MNKGAIKERLEQGQIIVDYINNHLLLAWNELTLLNQAMDQNKKMLNLTLHHVKSLSVAGAKHEAKHSGTNLRKIIFAFPNVVDNFVFFDETFVEWLAGFGSTDGTIYIMSPSIDRGYANELVIALKAKNLPYVFLNFVLGHGDASDNDPFTFLQNNIFNASQLVFTTMVQASPLHSATFYVAHSTLISQNYNFTVYPLEQGGDLDNVKQFGALAPVDVNEKLRKRVYVPNEIVATHNATVYAIACRWRNFLLDNQKNKTLKKIIEWQNTLDRQVVENKRLMMRYRGAITDEDIQELAVLNAEDA